MDLSQQILSDIIVFMKYAKYVESLKRRETYFELVERNKNMHKKRFPSLKEEIDKAYQYVHDKKVLPSMRSFQFAGKPIEINPSRIFNCCAIPVDDPKAFSEIMFLLLGGTGVGFSVQNHDVEKLPEIRKPKKRTKRFLVGDSIEGWADAVKALMSSYFEGTSTVIFDFGDIREKGAKLVTSGGKAPGPEPLKVCLTKMESILSEKTEGDQLTSIEAHDLICLIADAVLAGGIRRAALISLFSADDDEMVSCKFGNWYETHPFRARANNSAVLLRHRAKKNFFKDLWEKIKESNSGEPGFLFSNDKYWSTNPCCEISLRPFQTCNLVEMNVSNLESQEDYNNRAIAAAFIGTLQASYTDFHYLRPIWKKTTEKDALIGIGMTGIASNKVFEFDQVEAAEAAIKENKRVAKLLGIKRAARVTCVKPSGTTSLVLGCSSGIHAWHDDYYIRRIRVGKNEEIYAHLKKFNPELLEDDYFRPHDSAIISIPQKAPEGAVLRKNETALDLLERVKNISTGWVATGHITGNNSHNVSATISIKDDEWEEVGEWMWKNRAYYNGLSVLPYDGHVYKQAPYESCTKEVYEEMMKALTTVNLTDVFEDDDNTDLKGEISCQGGKCDVF